MARYTVLRLLIFFGVLCALWLAQLRGWPLLLLSAVVSAIISVFVLAGPREQVAQKLEEKVTERRERTDDHRTAEDEEDEESQEYTDR
ncbi:MULTISPECIES: DUF4229 domain-containing protein [Yimella]|uniref:Uncharacterized protein DUF4229 n=1 Tax=Yimella lutea TaxID=587872 RepID=A0A542EDN8_9MICO|nr:MULTISPECIES: DUF4229 domain-containing protein [Yimella]MCG8656319.1 DUF4229 domain-containing protein [Yimella sp. NH-Cas1]RYG77501.1 DUF4229 domain-containing protein [Yimella sp. RIT 621]TQJ13443.1 uncharacterized protein DUF4229 [Yimella lutea]